MSIRNNEKPIFRSKSPRNRLGFIPNLQHNKYSRDAYQRQLASWKRKSLHHVSRDPFEPKIAGTSRENYSNIVCVGASARNFSKNYWAMKYNNSTENIRNIPKGNISIIQSKSTGIKKKASSRSNLK